MIEQQSSISESNAEQDDGFVLDVAGSRVEVGLIDVLMLLARRKLLIAKVTGIAMLAGVIVSLALPVKYTAITRLMPPQQTQSSVSLLMNQLVSGGAGSLAAMAGGGGLSLKSPNDIYLGLIGSRPVADAIIQRFGLVSVYHARYMTDARKRLASSTVAASEKAGFISVAVTDKDKKRAAAIANAYTDQLRLLTKTLAVTEASQRRLFYEEQLKQAKDSLVAAELSFQQVQQKRGLIALDAQAKAMIEGLATLRAQIAAKQVGLQSLRSFSTDHNPDVELAERELSSLQEEAVRLEKRSNESGFINVGLEDVPGAGLEYLRADHEVKYQQALFDLLMKQYDAARLDEAKDAAIIQVVEPAIEPDRKSSPHRAQIVLLFMLLGFIAACSYLYLSDLALRNSEISDSLAELKSSIDGK